MALFRRWYTTLSYSAARWLIHSIRNDSGSSPGATWYDLLGVLATSNISFLSPLLSISSCGSWSARPLCPWLAACNSLATHSVSHLSLVIQIYLLPAQQQVIAGSHAGPGHASTIRLFLFVNPMNLRACSSAAETCSFWHFPQYAVCSMFAC